MATVALDGSGNVTAAQWTDAATGLDYYGARYYDPVAGQFTSADTVANGLSPYAYVRGDPETLTDPTGHRLCNPGNPDQCAPPPGSGGGSGSGSGSGSGAPKSVVVNGVTCFDQTCIQRETLNGLEAQGYEYILGAALLRLLAMGVAFMYGLKPLALLEIAADIIELFIGVVIPAVGVILRDKHIDSDAYAQLLTVAAGLDEAYGIIQDAIGAVQFGGFLVQELVAAGLVIAKTTVAGLPGAAEEIVATLFGSAMSFLLQGAANQVEALGYADLAQKDAQERMDPSAWCKAYAQAVCSGFPG